MLRSIPYVALAVGDLRFRATRSHPGWEGVRDAFVLARKSGRHFDKTPLEKVPIPLYRPGDAQHRRLAALSAGIREARVADPGFDYPGDCPRELGEIDEIVRGLLPAFCR